MSYIKTTYKGVSKKNNTDRLFSEVEVKIKPPKKSNRFNQPSLYYQGVYYFIEDISKTINLICEEGTERSEYINNAIWKKLHKGWLFTIRISFYDNKWRSDRRYITEEFKNFLLNHYNSTKF